MLFLEVNNSQLKKHKTSSGFNLNSSIQFFSLPAMPQAFVSYEFLSSSSGNTSFSHTSLYPILTKLGHSDQYLDHYSGTNNDRVRGHDGVTGVKNWKNVIHMKNMKIATK